MLRASGRGFRTSGNNCSSASRNGGVTGRPLHSRSAGKHRLPSIRARALEKMIQPRKYVVYATLSALVAIPLGLFVTGRGHAVIAAPGADSAPAIEVDVAQVTSTVITDYESYFGRTEAINKV